MKAVGVLVIGLGLLMIVVGITGSQHNILSSIKGTISPKLRAAQAGTLNQTGTASSTTSGGPDNTGGGIGNPAVTAT